MTINEFIGTCNRVIEKNTELYVYCVSHEDNINAQLYKETINTYKQLKEWLLELEMYRAEAMNNGITITLPG